MWQQNFEKKQQKPPTSQNIIQRNFEIKKMNLIKKILSSNEKFQTNATNYTPALAFIFNNPSYLRSIKNRSYSGKVS